MVNIMRPRVAMHLQDPVESACSWHTVRETVCPLWHATAAPGNGHKGGAMRHSWEMILSVLVVELRRMKAYLGGFSAIASWECVHVQWS